MTPRPWSDWDQDAAARASRPFDDNDPTVQPARINRGAVGYEPPSYHRAEVELPRLGPAAAALAVSAWAVIVAGLVAVGAPSILVVGLVLALVFALGVVTGHNLGGR